MTALTGGEAVTPALAAGLRAVSPDPWNVYGPTETTIYATLDPIGTDEPVPIGRPVDNTHAYVLDAAAAARPVGVTGELYIGGAGVGPRLPRRPALTAERFLPDPAPDHPGARMYRTGDLARWRPTAVSTSSAAPTTR